MDGVLVWETPFSRGGQGMPRAYRCHPLRLLGLRGGTGTAAGYKSVPQVDGGDQARRGGAGSAEVALSFHPRVQMARAGGLP